MGSGKSSIGLALAKSIDYTFIDSDTFITQQKKMTIPQIFQYYGEEYFRKLESNFILQHQNIKQTVIATGGGMPIFNDVKKLGYVFFLKATFKTIYNRIHSSQDRPLFKDKKALYQLFIKRQDIYRTKSNFIIDTEKGIQNSINQIREKIKNLSPDT
ncbi:shikimate kinase [Helicobacter sp. 'CLO3_human']|nr:shikimate kinase [Helicobacter sp. 'CLO3_human']